MSRGDEFLTQMRRAISLQPDLPVAYVGLSDAQGDLGDFDAALAAGEHCQALSPNDAACSLPSARRSSNLAKRAPPCTTSRRRSRGIRCHRPTSWPSTAPPSGRTEFRGGHSRRRRLPGQVTGLHVCRSVGPSSGRAWTHLRSQGGGGEASPASSRADSRELSAGVLARNKEASELRDRRIAAAVLAGFAPFLRNDGPAPAKGDAASAIGALARMSSPCRQRCPLERERPPGVAAAGQPPAQRLTSRDVGRYR